MRTKDTTIVFVADDKTTSEITVSIGEDDNYEGRLVFKQDGDTVVVPEDEAIEFATKLLAWLEARNG